MKNNTMTVNDMMKYLDSFVKNGYGDAPIYLGDGNISLTDDAFSATYIKGPGMVDGKLIPAIHVKNKWYDKSMALAADELQGSIITAIQEYMENAIMSGSDMGKKQYVVLDQKTKKKILREAIIQNKDLDGDIVQYNGNRYTVNFWKGIVRPLLADGDFVYYENEGE